MLTFLDGPIMPMPKPQRVQGATTGAWRFLTVTVLLLGLSGCAASARHLHHDPAQEAAGQSAVLDSSPPVNVATPYDIPLACMADRISERRGVPLRVAVGNIRDYTGRFSERDGGAPVTQGGSQMAISALGKLGHAVQVLERYDIEASEREQGYEARQQLGSGHGGTPWREFQPGRIMPSDVFLVGGITEINYNISSGGAEVRLNGIGPRARTFTLNAAVDLRLVETQSLRVIDTVSLQKQLVGYEVGLDAFRFFGDTLVDLNAGVRQQEAMDLGVRTVIELGVLELMASMAEVDGAQCLRANSMYRPPENPNG